MGSRVGPFGSNEEIEREVRALAFFMAEQGRAAALAAREYIGAYQSTHTPKQTLRFADEVVADLLLQLGRWAPVTGSNEPDTAPKRRVTGTVKWFDDAKGYGFIEPDDGSEEVFVHHSEIVGSSYKTIPLGVKVEFDLVHEAKSARAANVVRWSSRAQSDR